MKRQISIIEGLSRLLDRIAGLFLFAVMSLVVVHVFMNGLFKKPILGIYEYVGFLTASAIGLSLAHCAIQDGHIAIELVFEKLSAKTRLIVEIAMGTAALIFFGIATWQIGKYAYSMVVSGEKSPTTMTPVYPFIFIVAFGVLMLCLAVATKLMEALKKVIQE
jgi:TRAP-type C4-dicarboxylate transport system permease small subunit